MRFNVPKQRAVAKIIADNPKPATADGVEELVYTILEACDEIDFHKQRRTFHDTLTLMMHEHTAKCLEEYRRAFSDLVEYTNECADFRNGVTDNGGTVDEGTIRASRFISDLKHRLFMTETHQGRAQVPIQKKRDVKKCSTCDGKGSYLGPCAQDPVDRCEDCLGTGSVQYEW